MDFTPLIKARKALDSLWKLADSKGRLWGPAKEDNPFRRSNITFAKGTELVSIIQGEDGSLIINEFRITKNTSLGNEVKNILKKKGLFFK